jgi:hypothetical protein
MLKVVDFKETNLTSISDKLQKADMAFMTINSEKHYPL